MRSLHAAELLDLWEAGQAGTPMERAVLLLRSACGDDPPIEQWTLGKVNARLLKLRALLFGGELECLANCPRCDAVAATQLDVEKILANAGDVATEPRQLQVHDRNITVRLPTAGDLMELGRSSAATGSQLVSRLVDASTSGDAKRATAETPELASALGACVAHEDPLACIELVVSCPACAHRWTAPLYAIDILWTEIAALAQRLIYEVARLARAFGWREEDILRMSARRRQQYLEVLTA
jgi:hypothetical protein